MSDGKVEEQLSEARRREIFQALVEAQDRAMTVGQSRTFIAERFGVSENAIKDIEREGLEHNWPPL